MELRNYSKNYTLSNLIKSIMILALCTFSIYGCTESISDGLPYDHFHSLDWGDNPQHGQDFAIDTEYCKACHGDDLNGGVALVSCLSCHHSSSSDTRYLCQVCHGDYPSSAHGDTNYGVDRTSTGYTQGECIHCHDLASGSTNEYSLFAPMNGASQTGNFCFQCHTNTGSVQDGGITNNDYSATFGGASVDITSISQAFDSASSHDLGNIRDFIKSRWPATFTSSSNACSACHNTHIAQRNREYPGDPTYTAISRPTDHDNLWGDEDPDERMTAAAYGDYYQPPYHTGTDLEPDGTSSDRAAQAGKTPDYISLCQDCHTTNMGSGDYDYGLANTPIDWTTTGGESGGDKHGMNIATSSILDDLDEPYYSIWDTNGLILSCTDCHEPHGSGNAMLIRRQVNGAALSSTISIGSPKDLEPLCNRCHQQALHTIHHTTFGLADAPYDTTTCSSDCHNVNTGNHQIPCSNCHFHGGDDSWLVDPGSGVVNGANYVTYRRTF